MRRKQKLTNLRPTSEVCVSDSVQNAAQTLLANIRFSAVDNPISVLTITSSIPNEGKTTVALALAVSIARSGAKCLIIEGDMRRRSMKAVVGAKPRYGIYALMSGSCTYKEALASTQFENISFLDAEQGIPNPDALLSSARFTQLLDTLRKHFHFIIVDTPPVTAFADAAIIASHTDGTIVVAREGYTERRELDYAIGQLRAADANILGVVMNAQSGSDAGGYGYYYGYYYDEYKEDGSGSGNGGSSSISSLSGKAGSAASALKGMVAKQQENGTNQQATRTPQFSSKSSSNGTSSSSSKSLFQSSVINRGNSEDANLADKRERWRQMQEDSWSDDVDDAYEQAPVNRNNAKLRIPSFDEVVSNGKHAGDTANDEGR